MKITKKAIKEFLCPNKGKILAWLILLFFLSGAVFLTHLGGYFSYYYPSWIFPKTNIIEEWLYRQGFFPPSYLWHVANFYLEISSLILTAILTVLTILPEKLIPYLHWLSIPWLTLILASIEYYFFACLISCLWETPSKIGRILTTTLLLPVFIIPGYRYSNEETRSYVYSSQFMRVFVLRSSGLGTEEKKKLGLSFSDYQLTDYSPDADSLEAIHGYFLEKSDAKYRNLVGKCVQASGKIKKDWRVKNLRMNKFMINNQYTYNRSVLMPDKIEVTKFDDCDPYPSWEKKEIYDGKETSFEGTLARTTRPAPDINYDYELHLLKPYDNPFDASGLGQKRDRVIVVPSDNSVWLEIEKRIGQVITVQGYEKWGYTESSYLYVTNIRSTTPVRSEASVLAPNCVPEFTIETGPELTASQVYAQKCYDQNNKEGCEKVDIYNSSTRNFVNSDGIPDCRWIKK